MPGSDPLDQKHYKPELVYLRQISDLENFEKDNMILNLNNRHEILKTQI